MIEYLADEYAEPWHGEGRKAYQKCRRHYGVACDLCKQGRAAEARESRPSRGKGVPAGDTWDYDKWRKGS